MDKALFQKQLYELMKKYPKQEDFMNIMNTSLREAAQQVQDEQSMDNYVDVIIELIKNGRGGEDTTLQSFLAYWLALNEHGNWKDYYNDNRIIVVMSILKKKKPVTISQEELDKELAKPLWYGTGSKQQKELSQEDRNKILDAINTIDKLQKQLNGARKTDKTLDDKLKEQGI